MTIQEIQLEIIDEFDMFDDWIEWSKNELQTNVDARMTSITRTDELQQHNWKTRTFVGASMGSRKNKDGNAYASPLAGTSTAHCCRQDMHY